MASNLMDERLVLAGSEGVVDRYARCVCGIATVTSALSCKCMDFSLALNCGTHLGKSYVDIRCRFTKMELFKLPPPRNTIV